MTNIPILTYLQRYWFLLALAAGSVALTFSNTLFSRLGSLLYVPALVLVAVACNLLVTHLWFRETIDKETHDGTFLTEWRGLTAERRVTLTIAVRIAIFIGTCLIAAALSK